MLKPAADTTLFEAYTNHNLGAVSSLASGTTARFERSRAVMRFDLAGQIPPAASVRRAWLDMEVVRIPSGGGGTATRFHLYRILRPWGEGNKIGNGATGASATTGEATWRTRFHPTELWGSPGGEAGADHAEESISSQFVDSYGVYRWDGLASDVQFWLANPSSNFGWILISEDEASPATARRFGAREDIAAPPRLSVEYEQLPPRITRLERVGNQMRLHFEAVAGIPYMVQHRPTVDRGEWAALTNIPSGTVNRSLIIIDPGQFTNRFYRLAIP